MRFIYYLGFILVLPILVLGNTKSIDESPKINSKTIDGFLSTLVQHDFNGSVLVSNGKTVFKNCYGFADKENNLKCNPNTVFDIGSITKQFTGAAILKLEMMGKLSVDDKIDKFFDNVSDDKKDITIHQLLTHSSGLPSAIGDDYEVLNKSQFLDRAFKAKLQSQPGTTYKYSNVGYSILATIIEKTSGLGYETFLNKYLFKPAQMNKTGYKLPNWNKEEIAVGYSDGKHWGKPNEKNWGKTAPYWNLLGNGGILSNLDDLYKWDRILLTEKILNKKAKAKYNKRHIKEGEGANSFYGYGWAIFPTSRNTWLTAHNGGNGVFFADFWRFTDENVTIIFLTNSVRSEFERIPSEISKSIFQEDYSPSINFSKSEEIPGFDAHPNGKLIRDFIESIKNNEKEKISKFIKENFSAELFNIVTLKKHLEMLSEIGNEIKNADVEAISIAGDKTVIKFKNLEDKLTIMIEDGKIAGIIF